MGPCWGHYGWHWNGTVIEPSMAVGWIQLLKGKDVLGAIWLSLMPTLGTDYSAGTKQLHVMDWIAVSGRDRSMPMAFVHAEADSAAANFAQQCLKELRTGSVSNLTGDFPVVRAGILAGNGLLDKELRVHVAGQEMSVLDWIVGYAAQLVKPCAASGWDYRETEKTSSVWKFPGKDVSSRSMLPIDMMGLR